MGSFNWFLKFAINIEEKNLAHFFILLLIFEVLRLGT